MEGKQEKERKPVRKQPGFKGIIVNLPRIPGWNTKHDVARALGVGTHIVHRMIKDGRLDAHRFHGMILISDNELKRVLANFSVISEDEAAEYKRRLNLSEGIERVTSPAKDPKGLGRKQGWWIEQQFLGRNAVEAFAEADKAGLISEPPAKKTLKKWIEAADIDMREEDFFNDCVVCGGQSGAARAAMDEPLSGEPICTNCLEDLLRQEFLQNVDEEDVSTLKQRVIEAIEKSDRLLVSIAATMAVQGDIEVADIL